MAMELANEAANRFMSGESTWTNKVASSSTVEHVAVNDTVEGSITSLPAIEEPECAPAPEKDSLSEAKAKIEEMLRRLA